MAGDVEAEQFLLEGEAVGGSELALSSRSRGNFGFWIFDFGWSAKIKGGVVIVMAVGGGLSDAAGVAEKFGKFRRKSFARGRWRRGVRGAEIEKHAVGGLLDLGGRLVSAE